MKDGWAVYPGVGGALQEGWAVYPGIGGALLAPLLLAVRVCSVCKGGGGEIEEPCAYYFTS